MPANRTLLSKRYGAMCLRM